MTPGPRRGRRLHAVAVATALGLACPTLLALEGVVRPEVMIDGFRLEPFANFITGDGRNQFHPKAMLGFGFDSNVYAQPDEETADGYLRTVAGIEGRYTSGLFDLVVYDLELEAKIFFQEDGRDLLGGRFKGEWVHEGIEYITSTKLNWARYDDPLVESGERVQRSEYGAGFDIGRQHPFGEWVVESRLGRQEYHDDALTFTGEERSNWKASIGAGYTRRFSQTGKVTGEGYVETSVYDESTRFNDNWILGALATWQGRLGDRTTLVATGGVEGRFYSDDFLGDSSYDDAVVVLPVAKILGRWQYRSFSRVDLQLYSRGANSATANASWIYGLASEWMHAIDERWRAGGGLDYYFIRNSGAAEGLTIDQRRTLRIHAHCGVELVRGIGGRFKAAYTTSDAELSNDFDRFELALEGAVTF